MNLLLSIANLIAGIIVGFVVGCCVTRAIWLRRMMSHVEKTTRLLLPIIEEQKLPMPPSMKKLAKSFKIKTQDEPLVCEKCQNPLVCVTAQDGGMWMCDNPKCVSHQTVDTAGRIISQRESVN